MGRWSKHHDQRKGQWLINYIRFVMNATGEHEGRILFNMENDKFDKLMEEYYNQGLPTGFPTQEKADEISRKALSKVFDSKLVDDIMKINKEVRGD